jgi:hypothetical protein
MTTKLERTVRCDSPAAVVTGELVRTVEAWPGGIHRAEVKRIYLRDGKLWADVTGASYLAEQLQVIRPPLG